MQEAFLHYVWQFKKFDTSNLKTTVGEAITLHNNGQPNLNSGPDFFNAQLEIEGQLWAGNVEIHIKSSDWYVHNHEMDPTYDNVILHVVYEHDTDIFRKDNSIIPTLQLKNLIHANVFNNFQKLLMSPHKWINCEPDFAEVEDFVISNWLERLYIERLERKSRTIEVLLKSSKNDWEGVLFKLLAKNFGLKVNGEAILSMANSFDFSVVRKMQSQPLQLEALFFGQSGLLETPVENGYFQNLSSEYLFIKQKFNLSNDQVIPLQFFRLRPPNFPTIRLSQLAMLYQKHTNLFTKLMAANTIEDLYKLFQVGTSEFWQTHFTFEKASRDSKKLLTKNFIDLLLINTVLPLRFCYLQHLGKPASESCLLMAQNIASEQNGIIKGFNNLTPISDSALTSQALIQLKTEYCDKNKCMACAIGNSLLARQ
ncbi:DUF2851 family protein [Gelidibacter sp.]|uniref:DUF2851 family protein n=1 Tax=Gelidibacter sp. TaxID=2018083 RepID=UPI002C9EC264|nr:DUF2851 family protein [Gelidibacter sp.]HUH26738.1 DUF2851 family protein [Gelidibacter sp.]